MGHERTRAGAPGDTVVSSVEDSGRPLMYGEIPELEVDETIPPRPEEELADLLRAEPEA